MHLIWDHTKTTTLLSLSLSLITCTIFNFILIFILFIFSFDCLIGGINVYLFIYITRCPPCKLIKPVYESLSDEYPNISFGKIDIDDNQDSAMEYEISSVPTFLFFNDKGEKKYGQFSGADQEQLKKIIDDLNNEP